MICRGSFVVIGGLCDADSAGVWLVCMHARVFPTSFFILPFGCNGIVISLVQIQMLKIYITLVSHWLNGFSHSSCLCLPEWTLRGLAPTPCDPANG